MIVNNTSLSVLFLHWNKLQSKGGQYIAKAMSKNTSIQILDLSFCAMGSQRETQEKMIQKEIKEAQIQLAKANNKNQKEDHNIVSQTMKQSPR